MKVAIPAYYKSTPYGTEHNNVISAGLTRRIPMVSGSIYLLVGRGNARIHAAYRRKARRGTEAMTNLLSLMPA